MNYHYNTISSGTQEIFWGGNPGRAGGRNCDNISHYNRIGSCGEFWGKSRITPCILPLLALQTWF